MGDEHRASEPTAPGAEPNPASGRRRDPDASRTAPTPATTEEVRTADGGGDPTGTEAAGGTALTADGAGHRDGSSAETETRDATRAAALETGQGREKLNLDDLEFHCVRALRYHEARAAFLDLWRRILDFAVIVLGAGAVTTLIAQSPFWGAVLNVSTAAIGAIQLVASLGDKAQEHRWVHRRYAELYGRVTEAKLLDAVEPEEMRKLVKRWSAIWPDEGTTMHVLEAVAFNAAVRTLNSKVDPGDLIKIGPLESIFRNIFSQEGFEAVTPNDKRRAAEAATDGGDA